ncbi:hypothetical protein OH77DRAFT_1526004 [Trametes cingulata]|nr:hypothetical protein OH77DRAFT_1526004 [Trametes cingulata]
MRSGLRYGMPLSPPCAAVGAWSDPRPTKRERDMRTDYRTTYENATSGLFCRNSSAALAHSDSLWAEQHAAGEREYDRFNWRMPLDEEYGPQIHPSHADLCNTGGKRAGCCTAALFLKSFVEGVERADGADEPAIRWAHLDISQLMEASRSTAYQEKGVTGRPGTRASIEFARRMA